ncbi:hypothetical protein WJX73_003926 [Symbiochloris irregularis]|uniref:Uncharacterized protein n=1 Tax=Symbiochloris irregularis TaxID=706552 RepID=A0AAW1PZW7_9CHLO
MAVDLGGEFLKIGLVRPGRAVSIAINEFSKRKTSAQVSFVHSERQLGEDAAALSPRYPDLVFSRARDLLGKLASDPQLKEAHSSSLLQYTLTADKDRKTVAVKAGKQQYSAEELVASLLHYAKGVAEKAAEGAAVQDAAIAVPPFFGPAQRQAIMDAADIAGLNVLALVNSHVAAALQFGFYRNFENRSEVLLLYDLGATSTSAALVRFAGPDAGDNSTSSGKGKTATRAAAVEGLEVLDVAWDADTGVEQLDGLLVRHFAAEFNDKHGKDLFKSQRAIAKLKRQVKRTKEVLSANMEAPISVEEILDGIDFRSSISRKAFEELAGDFFDKAAAPAVEVLRRSGVQAQDLAAVELLGGGSRIPAVKAALTAALDGRSLDMHLDADEAMALGTGLVAANKSSTFRLRKFGAADTVMYPIDFQVEPSKGLRTEGAEGLLAPKVLMPFNKRLPADRVAKLPNTTADSLTFTLSFNQSEGRPLPPGHTQLLARYEVSGIKAVVAKHKETGKMSVHFRADESGLVKPTHAEAVLEVTEEYTVKVPVATEPDPAATKSKPAATKRDRADNILADEDDGDSGDGSSTREEVVGGSNDTKPAPVQMETVTKTRRKSIKVPLKIAGPGLERPGMTAEQLKASRGLLASLASADVARAETAAAKNDLEAYILATGTHVGSDEEVQSVSTEAQREQLQALLSEAEDWLYMEGADEPADVFRKKLGELQATANPMFERAVERSKRPEAVEATRAFLDIMRKTVNSWDTIKPWVNATNKTALLEQADELEAWLEDAEKQQSKVADHEKPSLHSSEVTLRTEPVRKHFTRLKNIRKPKPPPTVGTNATAGGANATGAAQAENGTQSDGADPVSANAGAESDASAQADAKATDDASSEEPNHDEL